MKSSNARVLKQILLLLHSLPLPDPLLRHTTTTNCYVIRFEVHKDQYS